MRLPIEPRHQPHQLHQHLQTTHAEIQQLRIQMTVNTKWDKQLAGEGEKQAQDNTHKYSSTVTFLTCISFFLALSATTISPYFYLAAPLLTPNFYCLSQLPLQTLKYIVTCWIFGVLVGVSCKSIMGYYEGQREEAPLFALYTMLSCVYYYFQFQLINTYHHESLCWHSFLIYHSPQYSIANAFMLLEHFIMRYLCDFSYKHYHPLYLPAFIISLCGLTIRITAFFTAKSNFTHLVRYSKEDSHRLVTHGVYSLLRHPSYTGFFYFSVFQQVLLGNWVSAVAYAVVLSRFFEDRIYYEEICLAHFFEQYLEYKGRTYIGIPFVKDPKLLED